MQGIPHRNKGMPLSWLLKMQISGFDEPSKKWSWKQRDVVKAITAAWEAG